MCNFRFKDEEIEKLFLQRNKDAKEVKIMPLFFTKNYFVDIFNYINLKLLRSKKQYCYFYKDNLKIKIYSWFYTINGFEVNPGYYYKVVFNVYYQDIQRESYKSGVLDTLIIFFNDYLEDAYKTENIVIKSIEIDQDFIKQIVYE